MEKPSIVERRHSPRFKVECEAELFASLALLNTTETEKLSPSLVFMGATHNLSLSGLAVALPSICIDENYCKEPHSLTVTLHLLPSSSVEVEINPLHCQPLNAKDPAQGYLIGARISNLSADAKMELNTFLQDVAARQSEV